LVVFLFLMSAEMIFGQEDWRKEGIKIPPPICYASDEVHQSNIRPPAEYLERLKSGSLKKSTIFVDYKGFPDDARLAFQYAVDIWSTLVYSPVPIHVLANWVSLETGVLGSCGPANYYKNFNSTQVWNCYYPVALVEKMLGEEVNGSENYDIEGSFNKDFSNWYFGLDGNTPTNQYDFVSTALHELAHGLGFSGFFYSQSGTGGYGGGDGFSAIFDQFVINQNGQKLIDTKIFTNPSKLLSQNLTSGWLAFDTKLVEGSLPRLYAPATWDDGSSLYHLNENTYQAKDPNSLMTPFAGKGESIHDPGPNTMAIMADMGWRSISIKHQQLKDIELVTAPINFDAQIESDFDLDSTKLYLCYSTTNFTKTDSVLLKATGQLTHFNAQINQTKNTEVRYYFVASDVKNRKYVFPSSAPTRYLSFTIGTDKKAPVITHEPIKYLLAINPSVKITAVVTDNIGVKSVKLKYFVPGGNVESIDLVNDSLDIYSVELAFPKGSVKDGDLISYRIVAIDNSSQLNIGQLPVSGYFTFKIEGFQVPVDRYVTDFNSIPNDFAGTDFTIKTVSGFDNPALNSAHPYPSPDSDNTNFNFSTVLKYPILLKAGGKMSFDEIVLVEPGDVGNNFGDANFWDYVIVEGSKDGGKNWKPFADGYDSNAQIAWANLFNLNMVGNNSTSMPTKDLFVKHQIDLLANGNFKAGDTVMVRFRLFSDPYSHGWGWIIDNLAIQDFETAINPVLLSSGEVILYPNPTTDQLNIQIQSKLNIHQLFLKVYNSSGKLIYNQAYPVESNQFQTKIDVSNFIPGLYLFALEPENGQIITRKIIIQ